MAWIPRYKSSGLCSPFIPNGDLSGLISLCEQYGNLFDVPEGISGNYSSYEDAPDGLHTWSGAFGFNVYDALLSKLKTEAKSGGATHSSITIAELEIQKPTGAQYYKQTIAVIGEYSIGAETTSHGYHGEEAFVLKWAGGNFSVLKVVRREYSTPYSQYTSTDLIVQTIGQNFCIVVEGYNDYWIENRESFLKKLYFSMSFATYHNVKYFCWAIYAELANQADYDSRVKTGVGGQISGLTERHLEDVYDTDFEPDEQDDPNEDPEEEGNDEDGGDGDHNRPVDDIDVPPLPDLGAVDAGFITLYHLSPAEMWVFAQHFFGETLLDIIRLYFNNPMDIFVGAGIVPFTPPGNDIWYPKIGGAYLSSQPLTKVSEQFVEIDCGSVYIEPYGKNCFDYSPYTKIGIFLPYIGYRELDVDEVMGQSIHVIYHCDVLSGDCVAYIYTTIPRKGLNVPGRVVIDQYQGNLLTQIPVGSVSFDQMVRGLIDIAATGIDAGIKAVGNVSGLSGDVGGMSSMEALTASTAAIVAGAKPTTRNGGSIGASGGYMSIQKPYIIRHIPNQSLPDNYGNFFGYPCNRSGTLGDNNFTGFAIVEDIQLNNVPAMEDERKEILDWLRRGVLL